MLRSLTVRAMLPLMVALALVTLGCGGGDTPKSKPTPAKGSTEGAGAAVDDHSGWWCDRHGLPEDDCAMCNAKLAAEYKAKGDWCKEHDRPESLCFKCDPGRAKKYAVLYKQRYGKEPPAPTD